MLVTNSSHRLLTIWRMIAVLAVALTLAACTATGSHDTSTSVPPSGGVSSGASTPGTNPTSTKSVTPYCAKLRAAGLRIQQAQVQIYTSSNGKSAAVDALVSELNALKAGAPASIKAALTELGTAFRSAQSLLAHPSSANGAKLAQIGSKLASDAQQISAYVASKC